MSPRELLFAKNNKENFYIYRVYNLDEKENNGVFYIFNDDIDSFFNKIPTGFRLSKK